METLTVRISRAAHLTLRELSDEANEPMTVVLERAVEAYRRLMFLNGLNADFAALKSDPKAWAEEEEERAAWETTLADNF